jgi:anti-sigma B factor antagonist
MINPVVVKQLPEMLKLQQVQAFLREVEPLFHADRPRVVFDFSRVRQMDSAGVDMLLYCVEEAMKRNGDLKLAAIRPASAIILELTRVDRLFEVFETVTEAVDSFSGFSAFKENDSYKCHPGAYDSNEPINPCLKVAS